MVPYRFVPACPPVCEAESTISCEPGTERILAQGVPQLRSSFPLLWYFKVVLAWSCQNNTGLNVSSSAGRLALFLLIPCSVIIGFTPAITPALACGNDNPAFRMSSGSVSPG